MKKVILVDIGSKQTKDLQFTSQTKENLVRIELKIQNLAANIIG